jgi:hypothetical protein
VFVALLNALLYLEGALEAPPACALPDTNGPKGASASVAAIAIRALDINSSVTYFSGLTPLAKIMIRYTARDNQILVAEFLCLQSRQ